MEKYMIRSSSKNGVYVVSISRNDYNIYCWPPQNLITCDVMCLQETVAKNENKVRRRCVTLPPSWPGSLPAASADQQLLAPPSASLSKSKNRKNREI
jgi:hypothetical protein